MIRTTLEHRRRARAKARREVRYLELVRAEEPGLAASPDDLLLRLGYGFTEAAARDRLEAALARSADYLIPRATAETLAAAALAELCPSVGAALATGYADADRVAWDALVASVPASR
ncbi:MAG TPA: hypothetical protein VNR17_10115 [Luteimicrobium sp.]|nr:hypothetical protein [Luteimicrobium sp.]